MKGMSKDNDWCLKGVDAREERSFNEMRIEMLRDDVLPSLKKLLKDIDKSSMVTPHFKYQNKKGKIVSVFPYPLLKQLYSYTSKLIEEYYRVVEGDKK